MITALITSVLISSAPLGPVPNADTEPGNIRAVIQVIHATRGKPMVDPALKKLNRYLSRSFSQYQSFKQVSHGRMVLRKNQKGTRKLPNETELKLTYLGKAESLLRLAMDVGGMSTKVKIHDGGLFFQAGRKYQGGMLIVAIRIHAQD